MNETADTSKTFANDLDRWAADRGGPGEPPTADELVALRDGTLAEADAERVREWIALDPEWAAAWRDLRDFGSWADSDETPPVEVDAAWRAVASRLPDAAAPSPEVVVPPPVTAARSWTWSPAWGLAATLILALAAWLVLAPWSTVDESRWKRHELAVDTQRASGDVVLDAEHEGVILVVPVELVDRATRIEARAADTHEIFSVRSLAAVDEPTLRVERSALMDGGVVVVRGLDDGGTEVFRRALRVRLGS